MEKLILIHKDTLKDSIMSDKFFLSVLIFLGFSLLLILYKYLKKWKKQKSGSTIYIPNANFSTNSIRSKSSITLKTCITIENWWWIYSYIVKLYE